MSRIFIHIMEVVITNIKDEMFAKIQEKCREKISIEWMVSTKTAQGNTQNSEREVIKKMKEILDELNLTYEEAGSQQSKDFRNVGGIGLDIEIKKTDNKIIYFNDTCPSDKIYYIIIFTGKNYKRSSTKNMNIPPQILYMNGSEFLKDCDWLEMFQRELDILKDKYARGENKKELKGLLSVYPRPTYKGDISNYLKYIEGVSQVVAQSPST